jgi:hypothetical protein
MTLDEARRKVEEAKAKIPAVQSKTPPQAAAPGDISTGHVPGVRVALGDTYDAVSSAYPDGSPTTVSEKPALCLKSQGLYFFFTKDKILDNIRFDPPFDGPVYGVKLGDSFEDVKARLGQPVNSWASATISRAVEALCLDVATLPIKRTNNQLGNDGRLTVIPQPRPSAARRFASTRHSGG